MSAPLGGPDTDLIVLGSIAGAHGIAGEVRVFAHNPDSDNLTSAKSVRVRGKDGAVRTLEVQRSRRHKQFFLMKLAGIDDRNAAEASRGLDLLLPRKELAQTKAGEFYVRDLVGVAMTTDLGRSLGTVVDVFEAGAAPVVVARAEGSKLEHMIAFSDDAVVSVDLEAKTMVVRERAVVSG